VESLVRVARLAVNATASLLLVVTTSLPMTEIADLLDDSWSEDRASETPSGSASDGPPVPRPALERHGHVLLADECCPAVACVVVVPAVAPSLRDVRDSYVRLRPRPRQRPRSVRLVGKDLERGPPPAA
jgi:hypothetical protein